MYSCLTANVNRLRMTVYICFAWFGDRVFISPLPLVEKLKEVVKNLTIKCVQLTEQSKKFSAKVDGQQIQISRLTDKVMEQSNTIDRLQEKASDLRRLERHLGKEQVQLIVERSKALEQAERANKRPKRAFEMSR